MKRIASVWLPVSDQAKLMKIHHRVLNRYFA